MPQNWVETLYWHRTTLEQKWDEKTRKTQKMLDWWHQGLNRTLDSYMYPSCSGQTKTQCDCYTCVTQNVRIAHVGSKSEKRGVPHIQRTFLSSPSYSNYHVVRKQRSNDGTNTSRHQLVGCGASELRRRSGSQRVRQHNHRTCSYVTNRPHTVKSVSSIVILGYITKKISLKPKQSKF